MRLAVAEAGLNGSYFNTTSLGFLTGATTTTIACNNYHNNLIQKHNNINYFHNNLNSPSTPPSTHALPSLPPCSFPLVASDSASSLYETYKAGQPVNLGNAWSWNGNLGTYVNR